MSVRTIESTVNCNVEEAQEWLSASLNDALTIPGNREAQIVISYLEEDGQLNVITGNMDSSDGTWDCRTQSHVCHVGAGDSIYGEAHQAWGLQAFNSLADQMNNLVDNLIPESDRDDSHDVHISSIEFDLESNDD